MPDTLRNRLRSFGLASVVLVAGFATTLWDLARYCLSEELFSYILIVPLITGILTARNWRALDHRFSPAPRAAAGLAVVAVVFLVISFLKSSPLDPANIGSLGFRTLAFVAAWIAIALWTLGGRIVSGLAFPVAFLIFMTPLPPNVVIALERGLQHASAEVSSWLFPLVDIPFFRSGFSFQLPTITIQVAPECSGIRSTLVLFITSLIAGYLFLDRSWQRASLAALVIPLGIMRNAVRIVTIGWLCTNHGPEMIHSPIHHSGGPVFFAISLLPLFAMALLFRRFTKPAGRTGADLTETPPLAASAQESGVSSG